MIKIKTWFKLYKSYIANKIMYNNLNIVLRGILDYYKCYELI